ncbi:MAG: glycosyltransferase family protein [Selenomonadaceae bacterium]|nr:glycosyltransferase family protein [Selenomonadaceae bacterium]MBQ5732484.1 glycosyltransferase family protein [Selenomonadaceae bacterium]MBQ5921512.1 glycosyltransferase family protein [Selenomonadaceae bacterium]
MQEVYLDRQDFQVVAAWQQGCPEPLFSQPEPDLGGIKISAGTRIAFITCVNRPELYAEALLYMKQLRLPDGMEAEFIPVTGAESMCSGYNQGMAKTSAAYKVYVHQDALIVNKNFVFDLLKIFAADDVGIVGMIGARKLPASGVWWDAMRTYGRVLHACEPECVVETACMEPVGDWLEMEALDGLLLATAVDVPWREDLFDGWHFYDVSMCKEMQRRGYKAVVPRQDSFWCIHCPKEKPLAAEYKTYQRRFLREYGHELEPEI